MSVSLSTVFATLFVVAPAPAASASSSVLALAPASEATSESQPSESDDEPGADDEDDDEPGRRLAGLVLRGFGTAGTVGLPGLGFGGGLSVGWLRKRVRLDLMGSGRLNRTAWYPSDEVGGDFSLWRVGLRGCAALGSGRIATPICLGADGGMVTASGTGIESSRTERQPWGSVFADIDLVWHVLPNIGLVATSRWLVPLVRREYYVGERGTLVTTPPFGVEIGLGLELVLP
ncbi:MAG: hypothetical protein AB1Z98_24205 [Nannocystaceae bacterium]